MIMFMISKVCVVHGRPSVLDFFNYLIAHSSTAFLPQPYGPRVHVLFLNNFES